MSSDDEYYFILHVGGHFIKDPYVRYVGVEVIRLKEDSYTISYFELCKIVKIGVEVDREGDDEGVESDGEGDLEKVESGGEGEVGEVQADGEGVSTTGIEVDEDIGMESGGHISLGPTVGEDNYSEVAVNEYAGDFATSNGVDNVADEYAGDFATSDRLDNVTDVRSGEEEGGNETEVWDSDEHGSLVGSDEDEKHEDATIKDHPKMKLREIQRRCDSEMHVNVTIDCCYRGKKIVKEKMAGNHKKEFGLL
ncbi:hypothetical protein Goshw_020982 [Gossypium schwendimanii]|uniref:Transposase MuDR plant domain-containing protein n=1 Tax=Gossypium schwendimanii TaxID=34291 RepID=A0A7J9MDE6_GOSSC|nr:hypothetical protein [Gossypium schwendimanii]